MLKRAPHRKKLQTTKMRSAAFPTVNDDRYTDWQRKAVLLILDYLRACIKGCKFSTGYHGAIMKQMFVSVRKVHLLLSGVLCLIFVSNSAAFSPCNNTGDPVQVNANCEDLSISNTKSGVTIGQSATVSPFFAPFDAVLVNPAGNVTGTFLNQGTITSGFGNNGFVNQGNVSAFTNEGTITDVSSSSSHAALINNNEIGTLTNKGVISATIGSFGAGPYAILQNAHIGTLNNSGVISAQNTAIYFTPGFTARIDSLINSGIIQGGLNGSPSSTFASAIELGPGNSIGTIINSGTIDHSVCDAGGTCYAAINNAGGTIGTITNQGNLTSGNTGNTGYGIINGTTGTIGTLNNAQGNLKYFGALPSNCVFRLNPTTIPAGKRPPFRWEKGQHFDSIAGTIPTKKASV